MKNKPIKQTKKQQHKTTPNKTDPQISNSASYTLWQIAS